MSLPSAPRDATEAAALLNEAAATLLNTPGRQGSVVRLADQSRTTVSGDLHDHLINLARIVSAAQLDSPANHVVVQELIHGPQLTHGCDMSHRMLLRIAALVQAYPGQVHPLLGNHELAQLLRRGVSKGGGNSVEQFVSGLEMVFADEAQLVSDAIDTFIRAMPLALITAEGICCAHSMPEPRLMGRFDTEVLDRPLTDIDRDGPFGSAFLLTWGRGHDDESLDTLAEAWRVEGFVLGHVHVDMGIAARGRRAVILNSEDDYGVLVQLLPNQPFEAKGLKQAAVPLQSIAIPEGVFS
ncbi:MAG: metallophosphoesterase [Phycisphaerales bacterium]|nr:metallophosphoesterase [Phycisphaerales bacterium]